MVLVLVVGYQATVSARPTRTEGDFQAVYRQDRWGVRRFGTFYILPDSEIDKTLASLKHQPVKLTAGRSTQYGNDGYFPVLHTATALEALSPSPLRIRIAPSHDNISEGTAFHVNVFVENVGTDTVGIKGTNVFASLRARFSPKTNTPHRSLPAYTWNQLSHSIHHTNLGVCPLVPVDKYKKPFDSILAHWNVIHIASKETFPLGILFPDGLPAEEYELEVLVDGIQAGNGKNTATFARAYLPLDVEVHSIRPNHEVPQVETKVKRQLRIIDKQLCRDSNTYHTLTLTLTFSEEGPGALVGGFDVDGDLHLAGRIRVFDMSGKRLKVNVIEGRLVGRDENLGWHLVPLGGEGRHIKIVFGVENGETTPSLDVIELDLLTERGVQTVCLIDAESFTTVLPGAGCSLLPTRQHTSTSGGIK